MSKHSLPEYVLDHTRILTVIKPYYSGSSLNILYLERRLNSSTQKLQLRRQDKCIVASGLMQFLKQFTAQETISTLNILLKLNMIHMDMDTYHMECKGN